MKLKQFLIDNREKLQLIYGIFLLILIPILLAYNTISIIGKYNDSMDKTLQREALAEGRTIYSFMASDLDDTAKIQSSVEEMAGRNSEIENVEVLVPEEKGYKIIASSQKDNIGKTSDFYFYKVAWDQPDNDGLATDSLKLTSDASSADADMDTNNDERFWIVAMPMQDASGIKKALLSVKISSKIIDNLTDDNRDASVYILIITIIITIFFLLVTVKIWDYVLLYGKIKEIDELKDEFISIASHELRTPLTTIKGYTSLIMEGTFGEIKNKNMKQSLERISNSAERLEDLVEDLLNVSRLEQGRLTVDNKPIQIEPVIEEMVSQLSINADEKKLSLVYDKPAKALPLVSADTERLKQVMVNLISNSIKYTDTGSITIATETKENKLRIKITDTGIGISPEAQKRLFQKFYRVQNEKTESVHGSGLGLWITKQIVELMGGEIYLESIEGQGTQVIVILNLAQGKKK